MTGAFVRVRRGSEWVNIEIDQLEDSELEAFFASQPEERVRAWAKFLAAWVRDHVRAQVAS